MTTPKRTLRTQNLEPEMTTHTPGPWRWTNGTDDIDISTYEAPGYYSNPELKGANDEFVIGCDEYWTIGPCFTAEEMVANARLIAAAPELLEACKGLLGLAMNGERFSERIAAGRAAIAKAEGNAA